MSKALIIYRKQINAWAEAKRIGGFVYDGHVWQSRPVDIDNLRDAKAAVDDGIPLPFPTWRTASNVEVPADGAYVRALYHRWGLHKAAVYEASWKAKAAMDAGQDPAAVLDGLDAAYDAALAELVGA